MKYNKNAELCECRDKERLIYIDIVRGIAVLCIIIGHLSNSTINRVVFTFHVPIFFIITGYFMLEKGTVCDYVKNKFRSLIIPYICTCFVIIILGMINGFALNGMDGAKCAIIEWTYASLYGAGDTYKEPFYIKQIGAIWFLWATFWGGIFLKVILKLKNVQRIIIVIVLFLVGYFSKDYFWFPLSIQAGCCATLFMYIGYICKCIKPVYETISVEIKHFFLIIAIIVWLCFIKDFKSFWFVHCDFGRGVVDIFGCLCACYVVMNISHIIETKIKCLGIGLAYIGRYSLFILCIHIVELTFFPWWDITNKLCELGMPAILELPLIIVGKFILNIVLMYFCSKSSRIRKLFGIKN